MRILKLQFNEKKQFFEVPLRMRNAMPSPESVVFLLGSVSIKRKEFVVPIYQFAFQTNFFSNFV